MLHTKLTRRQALAAASAAGLGLAAFARRSEAVTAFNPPAKLLEAAKAEGRMVLYTATFTEVMQENIAAFNKRFPFVKVELVRAPGGQLITRVQTEAAAGKLTADVVDHSDPALMKRLEHLFQDYAPPNAADYLKSALISPVLWPSVAPCWCIAYNTELVKNPPRTWMDLTKSEYGNGLIGQVIGPSGGTTWARIMFERMTLGEDYWAKQSATKPRLYPSGAPLSDSLVRGEVGIAPLVHDVIYPKKRAGAPIGILFGTEGVPITYYASGIPKTAKNINAARLFLDWMLSAEGQYFAITEHGDMSMLKNPPAVPEGFDPKINKIWVPDFAKSNELHDAWLGDWNKVYGYRQ
jgi:iron(III) transport system substrate-binding protein